MAIATEIVDVHERLIWEIGQLHNHYGGLPSRHEASDVWPRIWYEEAHNSTAIEGNTLVLKEVEQLLREGKAVGSKEMKDYLEVQGYAEAAEWVYEQALESDWQSSSLLSLSEVRHVHQLAMGRVWAEAPHSNALPEESPGNWRRHNIQAFPGGMKPPEFTEVPALMTDWVDRANHEVRAAERVAELVAACHAEFERIHPFLDGNGRTGRLLMNLMFVRLGYPPAIIYKRERSRYLKALDAVDRGQMAPLANMVARAVLDNLYRFVVPAVAGPARMVSLEALAQPGLSHGALRKAAERGRLRARRSELGTWISTRQWLEEYTRSRYQRAPQSRPKPRPSPRRLTYRPYVDATEVVAAQTLRELTRNTLAIRLTNIGREPARALLAHLHHPQLLFKRQGPARTLQPGRTIAASFFLEDVRGGQELAGTAWLFVQYSDLRGQVWLTVAPIRIGGNLSPPYGQIDFSIRSQQLEVKSLTRAFIHEERSMPDEELLRFITA